MKILKFIFKEFTDPFNSTSDLSVTVLEETDLGKERWHYKLSPDSRGLFGLSISGGVDQGKIFSQILTINK